MKEEADMADKDMDKTAIQEKIKAQGELVRQLKTEKADKDKVHSSFNVTMFILLK